MLHHFRVDDFLHYKSKNMFKAFEVKKFMLDSKMRKILLTPYLYDYVLEKITFNTRTVGMRPK